MNNLDRYFVTTLLVSIIAPHEPLFRQFGNVLIIWLLWVIGNRFVNRKPGV